MTMNLYLAPHLTSSISTLNVHIFFLSLIFEVNGKGQKS